MLKLISLLFTIIIASFSYSALAEYDNYHKDKNSYKKNGYKKSSHEKHNKHGFYQAAEEYQALAKKYRNKGMSDVAKSYERMAEIKNNAGKLADQNKWDEISWDEYHKLEEHINSKLHHKHK